jgi:hypothetical protein
MQAQYLPSRRILASAKQNNPFAREAGTATPLTSDDRFVWQWI